MPSYATRAEPLVSLCWCPSVVFTPGLRHSSKHFPSAANNGQRPTSFLFFLLAVQIGQCSWTGRSKSRPIAFGHFLCSLETISRIDSSEFPALEVSLELVTAVARRRRPNGVYVSFVSASPCSASQLTLPFSVAKSVETNTYIIFLTICTNMINAQSCRRCPCTGTRIGVRWTDLPTR